MMRIALAVMCACLAASAAYADNFHGFDPQAFDGKMLPADKLQAMVADASKTTAPRNGKHYVFGFANLERDIPFGVFVERGIKANAKAAGINLVVADNRLDGPTALANAQSFSQRNVDFTIEFQTDVNFGPTVMRVFDRAGIKVIAIDIPMPGAVFFGANNPKSGFMGGSYLAEAAIAKFGRDAVKKGYLVIGALPQSGAIPAMRTEGQIAGFKAMVDGFPENHVIEFDTKNTQQESFSQMSNVLGRIPAGVPIMATAINDQATLGIIQATKAAGRAEQLIAVGNGADEAKALATEPQYVAAPGYFPDRYGNYLIPMALEELAGKKLPPAVFMNHVMVTKANICTFHPNLPCNDKGAFQYSFPQEKFLAFLKTLSGKKELQGYEKLIPKS
jgi:ribose transport system substrate-binding protein